MRLDDRYEVVRRRTWIEGGKVKSEDYRPKGFVMRKVESFTHMSSPHRRDEKRSGAVKNAVPSVSFVKAV